MRDLIVFGEDFGGLPSSTQHIVCRLAKFRRVVWVNSIGLRKPRFNANDISRAVNKIFGKSKHGYQPAHIDSNIDVINIKTIPAPESRVARKLARTLILKQLAPILKKRNITDPILWTSLPTASDLAGYLDEYSVVYYCGDDFSSLEGVDHKVVSAHEKRLVKKADLILAASEKLCAKFPLEKTRYLPHGVDTELFAKPIKRALDLPTTGKPIAGFYGSLSKWLDYGLIDHICRSQPEWEFVFIGPNELKHFPLPTLNNVHYLGPKPHHELPSYSQHWDASLIPFALNEQIRSCNPLKLLEYLAVEKPIITTPFPALKGYEQHVHIAENTNEFANALSLISTRTHYLEPINIDNSWESRSHYVNSLLESL